jgi:3-oxoacyl-[acyl-carrier-protein] synthase III
VSITHQLPVDAGGALTQGRVRGHFAVAGCGTALPERRISNRDLARNLDTSDEWIRARTGICERRIAGPHESTASLATAAARQALAHAGIPARRVDVVVVATLTPERPTPSTAAHVVAGLGASAGAFDLNAACAGFVYGLTVAAGLIHMRSARTVLLIGADTMSRVVDPTDRSTAVLFGDGAGALVLTARDWSCTTTGDAGGIVSCDLVNDPEGLDLLAIAAGGSALPASPATVAAGAHYLRMDGEQLFRRVVRAAAGSISRALATAGVSADAVDLFVPHQANKRLVDAVLERVGIAPERTVQTIDRHANTSAASVPLALADAARDGALPNGSTVVISGFGAGLTVGTTFLRWTWQQGADTWTVP